MHSDAADITAISVSDIAYSSRRLFYEKVMIGVLVIIPIIIMLIVGMVTNFVSTQAHIGVEKVVVDKSTCTIHLSDLTINDKGQRIVNLNDYIGVTVLPEKPATKPLRGQSKEKWRA